MQSEFQKDKAWSQSRLSTDELFEILKPRFPHCVGLKQASDSEDKQGCDFWLLRQRGSPIAIDVKFRSKDCRQFGSDDLCFELDSGKVIGWSLDQRKTTDFIVWVWIDSGRAYVAPFAQALCIAAVNADRWRGVYGSRMVSNRSYETEVVFVPITDFEASVAQWNRGEFI